MSTHSRKTLQNISRGMMSGYPLFYLQGWEEERIERLLSLVAKSRLGESGRLVIWSPTSGFSDDDGAESVTHPLLAMHKILANPGPAIYLMKDLPAWFEGNPALIRAVRDAYYRLKETSTSIFFVHPELVLPEVIKKEVFLIEMDLPSEEEIVAELERRLEAANSKAGAERFAVDPDDLYRMAGAMKGLSLNEVDHLQNRLFRGEGLELDKALIEIQEEKSQLLKKESCLRFYPPQRSLQEIGGLENLKEWVLARKALFSKSALEAGVPAPSGLLLMGVSGCGKSMAAKAIAAAWELPLVRLDMSLVLSGSYGTPEYAFEHATRIAEEVAPIVLWVDEIENSFGFDEHVSGRGNVNIFSSLLTWLQEKDPKVFVAATANRIQELPAEFMRKGRFDQLFFIDLPHKSERVDIFRIHIELNGGNPDDFDLSYLSVATQEWSGAEIEQAVKSARIDAYQEGRAFNTRDLARTIARMVPLSSTMTEQIKAIKKWCFDRAVPASPAVE